MLLRIYGETEVARDTRYLKGYTRISVPPRPLPPPSRLLRSHLANDATKILSAPLISTSTSEEFNNWVHADVVPK